MAFGKAHGGFAPPLYAPQQLFFVNNRGGDFFNRHGCRVQERNAFGVEKGLAPGNLELALLEGGIPAVRPPLGADGLQALRIDRQSIDFLGKGRDRTRHVRKTILQVVLGEWVVCGIESILHRQIKAGRRFARTRYPHQDHVRPVIIFRGYAVVIDQCIIDRIDPGLIGRIIYKSVIPSNGMGRFRMKLALQDLDERVEKIQKKTVAVDDRLTDFRINQGAEDDRPVPLKAHPVDRFHGALRFFKGIDEGQRDVIEPDVIKLRQQTMADCFSGDGRTVGNIKNSSPWHESDPLCLFTDDAFVECRLFLALLKPHRPPGDRLLVSAHIGFILKD